MYGTFGTIALGRRARRILAATLMAAAGFTGVAAGSAEAALFKPCQLRACPDLTITNAEMWAGYVTVKNVGQVTARDSYLGKKHPNGALYSTHYVPALAPGSSYRVYVGRFCETQWNWHADIGNWVTESNEGNNARLGPWVC